MSIKHLPVVLLAMTAIAAPACATQRPYYRYPSPVRIDDRPYDDGFRLGRESGERDARDRRSFDVNRHDEYRDADRRYRGQDEYRRLFREGFSAGYREGYRQYARDYPATGPSRYPEYPVYRGRSGAYASPAASNGYRDGYEQGRDDARHNRRFDPIGSSRYRSGDHDYDRRNGSRDDYKRDYRAAFQQGYDAGYRDSRR
jgi:hypothetical protein